jgi:hypothetical protein
MSALPPIADVERCIQVSIWLSVYEYTPQSHLGLGVLFDALAPTFVPTPASAYYYHHRCYHHRYYHHRYYGYRPYYRHYHYGYYRPYYRHYHYGYYRPYWRYHHHHRWHHWRRWY